MGWAKEEECSGCQSGDGVVGGAALPLRLFVTWFRGRGGGLSFRTVMHAKQSPTRLHLPKHVLFPAWYSPSAKVAVRPVKCEIATQVPVRQAVKFLFTPQGPLRMRNWPRELCNFSTHHPVCLLFFGLLKLTCYFRKEREQPLRSIATAPALQKLCICPCLFTLCLKLSPEIGKHARHMYRLCFYLEALLYISGLDICMQI